VSCLQIRLCCVTCVSRILKELPRKAREEPVGTRRNEERAGRWVSPVISRGLGHAI